MGGETGQRVDSLGPLGAQEPVAVTVTPVPDVVGEHGGQYTEAGHSGQLILAGHLAVLQPVPVVDPGGGVQGRLDGVEGVVDGLVAVGVDGDLPAGPVGLADQVDQVGGRDDLGSGDVGSVVVALAQTGRVALDGPVGDELHGPQG